jgi:hypothetical protein
MFRSRPAPWAIIWAVYERRQRAWLAGVVAFGVFATGACTPVAPTASPTSTPAPGPTPQGAISNAQTAVTSAQTALPAAQGTVQAVATSAASVAASPQFQYITQVLSSILGGGVQLQIDQQPPDAPTAQVTSLRLKATDTSGAFSGLDKEGREKTAGVVLLAASQFYPQATVDLLIVDGNDRTLMTGTRQPGQSPTLSD